MYAVYRVTTSGGHPCYTHIKQSNIFGCNVGVVPRLLRPKLQSSASEPLFWHVDVAAELPTLHGPDSRFIVDLKPNSSSELALYELLDVWGYSDSGWTPAMFRLRGLIVDGEKSELRDGRFVPRGDDLHKTIYSFVYFAGTIREGVLEGTWTPPRASPTNSALLWPETLCYFVRSIRTTTPEVLGDA